MSKSSQENRSGKPKQGRRPDPYITVAAYFRPEHGGRHFIKGNEKDPFRSESQRQRIIAKNMRWFQKNQHLLQAMIMYQHPGNQVIWRWPAKQERVALVLWIKYKPEYAVYPVSSLGILKETLRSENKEEEIQHLYKLLSKASREIQDQKVWLVRIYRHPGNELFLEWSESQGETRPGSLLEAF